MTVYRFRGAIPDIAETAYIAPSAQVIGNVKLRNYSSVWFQTVLRGDDDSIVVGENTNIQDMSVCHVDAGVPLVIGNRITIGHRCVVHGCTIEDDCLIGMGAIVLSRAVIGHGSIIAAGSVVLEKTVIPPQSLVAGVPGKVKRKLDDDALEMIYSPVRAYSKRAMIYKNEDNFIPVVE